MARKTAEEPQITKAEAVRRALAEGIESPKAGVVFIKEKFGIDIAPVHFGAQKFQIRKRERELMGEIEDTGRGRSARGQDDLVKSMETLKVLVEQLGVDKVKRLAELLG